MKILGIGKNYVTNKSEIAALKRSPKLIFTKATSSLVTNNKDVAYPSFTNNVTYEVRLELKLEKKEI